MAVIVEINGKKGFIAADVLGDEDLAILYKASPETISFKKNPNCVPLTGEKVEIDVPGKDIGKGGYQVAGLPLFGNGLIERAFNGKGFGNDLLF